jgi:hypothetical protein
MHYSVRGTGRRIGPVPIHVEIFHFDRLVVAIARGSVSLQDYGAFIADLLRAGVIHYRKIIDTTSAESTTIDKDVLLAFDARLREYTRTRRGPLAVVADRNRGEIALAFKALTSSERPIEIFRSIHDARAWVAKFPVGEVIMKVPDEKK